MALSAALAELDEFSVDASCLQALTTAAGRLSALLSSGAHMPSHLLCQVASLPSSLLGSIMDAFQIRATMLSRHLMKEYRDSTLWRWS